MKAALALRVHPGARGNRVRGWLADGSLRVDVAEPPERGRANDAVVSLLAELLGVPESSVRITRGAGSRRKRAEIDGVDESEMKRRIDAAREDSSRGE